jgi:hypothetical protein
MQVVCRLSHAHVLLMARCSQVLYKTAKADVVWRSLLQTRFGSELCTYAHLSSRVLTYPDVS